MRHLSRGAFVLGVIAVQPRSRHPSEAACWIPAARRSNTSDLALWFAAQISSGSSGSAPVELAVVFGARLTLIQTLFFFFFFPSVSALGGVPRVAFTHFRGRCSGPLLVFLVGFVLLDGDGRSPVFPFAGGRVVRHLFVLVSPPGLGGTISFKCVHV